ncbi:trypsin-like [Argopecten irradians]|uniref:trypsin-like n=1 Tax=Argopecten irradians TaxID=31199 RepID=UPI003718D95A
MIIFTGYTLLICLQTASGRSFHIPHIYTGNIFHQGLHGHSTYNTHLTSQLWQYFLNHFGHSSHQSGSHSTQGGTHPHLNITATTTKPETPNTQAPEVGTDQSATALGIADTQRFDRWKNHWILNHLSSCGDQPIKPFFPIHRIIGGDQAVDGSWPWMVSFFSKTLRQHLCAGSIIDNHWIVSAAHCFVEWQLILHDIPDITDDIEVRVGLHNNTANTADKYLQIKHADHILVHPSFDLDTLDNDIALVRLNQPVRFNEHVKHVCLIGRDAQGTDNCVITGWGRQTQPESIPKFDPSAWPNVLKQAMLPVINHTDCSNLYRDKLTSHMICAGYLDGSVDACKGDSGGPLLCQATQDGRWAILGITSWEGLDYKGCSEKKQPGVYTKVSGYYNWILTSMFLHRRS